MISKIFKKNIYVMLLLLMFVYTGTVWAARESWVADPKTKCKICFVVDCSTGEQFGWVSTTDDVDLVKAEWSGPIVVGKADGQGVIKLTLRHRDGTAPWTIQGKARMKAGKLNGQAELKWAGYLFDDYSFTGYYQEGRREGKGILKIDLSRSYDGDWKEDRFTGKGMYLCEQYDEIDGGKYYAGIEEMYYGDWKDNGKNGQGTMKYADGRVYIGEWKDGVKQGKGMFKWPECERYQGDIYDGDWKNDARDGKGVMRYSDGSLKYQGDWKNNKIDGQGVYKWTNGEEYAGDFRENQREGQGTMKYVNGDVYTGQWKSDQRNGPGELKDSSGKIIFKGEWKNDQPVKP
jgi:hypothetical protein